VDLPANQLINFPIIPGLPGSQVIAKRIQDVTIYTLSFGKMQLLASFYLYLISYPSGGSENTFDRHQ